MSWQNRSTKEILRKSFQDAGIGGATLSSLSTLTFCARIRETQGCKDAKNEKSLLPTSFENHESPSESEEYISNEGLELYGR
jgi:hypothetical protein